LEVRRPDLDADSDGAPASRILVLLTRSFLKLVVLAAVLAIPPAWWAVKRWLRDFAYRIRPGVLVFALSLVVAFVIALTAVLFQGWKAGLRNPADVLRHE